MTVPTTLVITARLDDRQVTVNATHQNPYAAWAECANIITAWFESTQWYVVSGEVSTCA